MIRPLNLQVRQKEEWPRKEEKPRKEEDDLSKEEKALRTELDLAHRDVATLQRRLEKAEGSVGVQVRQIRGGE